MTNGLGNKKVMAENIKRLMNEKGVQGTEVCAALNIPSATFSNWCTGTTYPRIDKIEMMARYFGVKKSDLVEKKTELQKMAEEDARLVQKYRALSPEDRKTVIELLDFLYSKAQKQMQ